MTPIFISLPNPNMSHILKLVGLQIHPTSHLHYLKLFLILSMKFCGSSLVCNPKNLGDSCAQSFELLLQLIHQLVL